MPVQGTVCPRGFRNCISDLDDAGWLSLMGLTIICTIAMSLGLRRAIRTVLTSRRLDVKIREEERLSMEAPYATVQEVCMRSAHID